MSSTLIEDVTIAAMTDAELGLRGNSSVLIVNDKIAWIGATGEHPELPTDCRRLSLSGQLLTPALIDCHTHLVWAGSRAEEFSMRLHGASYEQIAEQGGGILSTVQATRQATEDELVELALPRAKALLQQGVTRLEIKSGYGLSEADELKQLRAARRLAAQLPISVHTTLLAAHALPPEYQDKADDYIAMVCEQIIPAAQQQGLVDAVDVFCERIGFSRAQTERVFKAARQLNIPVKLHAEQLSDQDGAALVADYQGLSADHLEYLSAKGIAAMAASGTVAVLLPGAFYFLRETTLPPIQALRNAKVPIAIATDANPGSSPLINLPLMMNMACTLFKLTPEEAWLGVTKHAAQALGCDHVGTIEVGKQADLAVWQLTSPAEMCYQFGVNPLTALWHRGEPCQT